MRRWIFILLLFLLCTSVLATANEVQESVLRLHILANSDNSHDQAIKLAVRDRILKDCGFLFAGCTDARSAAALAEENRALLTAAATRELREQGCLHPVSVRVGKTRFPTKTYGKVRLPAGRYTALEVRIGHADGKNCWCVMYPPLCLTGPVVSADQKTIEQLKACLSDSAYTMVTDETHITPQFRFKLAELFGKWL